MGRFTNPRDLYFGEGARHEVKNLKGKKVAVTWAYSPSYGKPLSCPQSLISLLPRFGMDVTLAHPEATTSCPRSSSALNKQSLLRLVRFRRCAYAWLAYHGPYKGCAPLFGS